VQIDVLFLPSVRRAAALILAIAALLAVATTASAAGDAKPVSVKEIQAALVFKRPDGVMGPKTRRAIKRFQRAHRLKADGVAGPETLKALGLIETSRSLASTPEGIAAVLAEIADCESDGNPAAVSPSGQYRGKYQFSQETWESLGGTGDPAEADENVQDMYAAGLFKQRGLKPWPDCAAKVEAELDS
jgi:peptidoglycan hydrolase-like protein with peptidoglycan-binding domain